MLRSLFDTKLHIAATLGDISGDYSLYFSGEQEPFFLVLVKLSHIILCEDRVQLYLSTYYTITIYIKTK